MDAYQLIWYQVILTLLDLMDMWIIVVSIETLRLTLAVIISVGVLPWGILLKFFKATTTAIIIIIINYYIYTVFNSCFKFLSFLFFFLFLQSVSPSVGCMHSHWRSGCKHSSEHMEGVKKVSSVPVCDCRFDIPIWAKGFCTQEAKHISILEKKRNIERYLYPK